MATISNQSTLPSPSSEQNVIKRVSELPLVKDLTDYSYSYVQSNSISKLVYENSERISTQILSLMEPLQSRLPISYANNLGNSAVDYLEKVVPQVNTVRAEDLYKSIKSSPVGPALNLAQSRYVSVSEALQTRLQQGQETVTALESRLLSLASAVPKDKKAVSEIVNTLFRELDSLSTYIATQRAELPAHAQKTVQPILDRLQESFTHIREEVAKPDVPITTKATTVLSYTQTQLSPLINDAVKVVKTVIEGVTSKAEEVKDDTEVIGEKVVEKVQATVEKVEKKSKKSKINGSA